jgi:hypothetical protein
MTFPVCWPGRARGAIAPSLTFLFLAVYPGVGRGVKAKRKVNKMAVRKVRFVENYEIASRLTMTGRFKRKKNLTLFVHQTKKASRKNERRIIRNSV